MGSMCDICHTHRQKLLYLTIKKVNSFISMYICHLNENVWKLRTVILKIFNYRDNLYVCKEHLHLWIGPIKDA